MNVVPEIWARIPAWPAYEASTEGRIRRIGSDRTMTPSPATRGKYLVVCLSRDGDSATPYVHRLIAATHLGSVDGLVVHHINSCPQDNRVVNLEITTQRLNMQRAQIDGTAHVLAGELTPEQWGLRGDLTPVQVQTLRRARAGGKRGAAQLRLLHTDGQHDPKQSAWHCWPGGGCRRSHCGAQGVG